MNLLTHFLIPHKTNNQRAKLLHLDTLFILALLFFSAGFFLPSVQQSHPQVLGVHIDITSQDLLLLTNQQRIANGLAPLVLNDKLTQAAQLNADYMLKKNYWSHFAPDGTSPWSFIKNAGYDYTYAGQNLARGYTSAQDAVNAWMASPDHRANILSHNFADVGFAVTQGDLTGEKDTVLIVEMFGNTGQPLALKNTGKEIQTTVSQNTLGDSQVALQTNPLIDVPSLGKKVVFFILFILLGVFVVDILIARSRNLARVIGHNVDHILFLACILGYVLFALGGLVN